IASCTMAKRRDRPPGYLGMWCGSGYSRVTVTVRVATPMHPPTKAARATATSRATRAKGAGMASAFRGDGREAGSRTPRAAQADGRRADEEERAAQRPADEHLRAGGFRLVNRGRFRCRGVEVTGLEL